VGLRARRGERDTPARVATARPGWPGSARLALDGRLAVAEPKTVRYRILNAATQLTCS